MQRLKDKLMPQNDPVLEDELRVLNAKVLEKDAQIKRLTEENEEIKEALSKTAPNRICSIQMDPVRLTAQLRAINPSIRAEWWGSRLVVLSDEKLPQSQVKAVLGKMSGLVDLT